MSRAPAAPETPTRAEHLTLARNSSFSPLVAQYTIFFRKCRYFNSLSNATYPIQIHRAVLENLQFEKKSEKNFNLKYLRNLWITYLQKITFSSITYDEI